MTDELWSPRGARPVEGRQRAAREPVYSVDDIRRAIARFLQESSRPATLYLLLGQDIHCAGPIVVPSDVPALTLDGGGIYGLRYAADLERLLVLEGVATRLLLHSLSVSSVPRPTGSANFVCTTLLASSAFESRGLRLVDVEIDDVTDILEPETIWSLVQASDCRFGPEPSASALSSVPRISDAPSGGVQRSAFVGQRGTCSVDLTSANSFGNRFVAFNGTSATPIASLDTAGGAGKNTFIGCSFAASGAGPLLSLDETDAYVSGDVSGDVAPGAFAGGLCGGESADVLSGASPAIFLPGGGLLRNLDVQGSGNIVIEDGMRPGQMLILRATAVSGTATLPNSAASNVSLTAAWAPTVGATLTLVWSATASLWIEVART